MSNEQPDLPKIADFDENENPTLKEQVTGFRDEDLAS